MHKRNHFETADDLLEYLRPYPVGDCLKPSIGCNFKYPHVKISGKRIQISRLIMRLQGHDIEGRVCMHSCDHPWCVNPAHISVGTYRDNMLDARQKGHFPSRKGELHPLATISAEDVGFVRWMAHCGILQKQIAIMFGLSGHHIGRIVRKLRWAEV